MDNKTISACDTKFAQDLSKNYDPSSVLKETYLTLDEQDNTIEESLLEADPSYIITSQSMIGRIEDIREKNWFARKFRPISSGGIRSSAFTIISGTVGAGILGLPKVATYFGLVTSLFLCLFFGLIIMWSYFILNDAIVNSNRKGYVNCAAFYFGRKGGISVFVICLLQCFCATTIYCVVSWEFIQTILDEFNIYSFVKHADADGNMIVDNYNPGNWLMRLYCIVPLSI